MKFRMSFWVFSNRKWARILDKSENSGAIGVTAQLDGLQIKAKTRQVTNLGTLNGVAKQSFGDITARMLSDVGILHPPARSFLVGYC